MFCRCATGFGDAENTRTCPVCLAHPGALPVPNRLAHRMDCQARARPRLPDRRASRLPPQAVLVPGPSEGLPDLPVRRAAVHRRPCRRPARGRRRSCRDRSRPPRGGRGEERPRRRRCRPHRRRGGDARRLQPRRNPARRDRHRAGSPRRRRGTPVPAAPSPVDRRAGHLGRGDGEGNAALRRQRLRPRGRRDRSPNAVGDQEHELLQLHRPGDRGGRPRADRAARGGRVRSPRRRTTTTRSRTR